MESPPRKEKIVFDLQISNCKNIYKEKISKAMEFTKNYAHLLYANSIRILKFCF